MTIILPNDKLRVMAEAVIKDDRHSAAAHQLARGVLSLHHDLEKAMRVIESLMDPSKAGTISGPEGKLYPITADGMREVIDVANGYRTRLQIVSQRLNHLRADIDGTLHPNSGMARQENPEQLL